MSTGILRNCYASGHSEQKILISKQQRFKQGPETERVYDCGESKMWSAVVASALFDAEKWIDSFANCKEKGYPTDSQRYHFVHLLYELKHKHFVEICSLINLHPDWIMKQIKRMATSRGLTLEELTK